MSSVKKIFAIIVILGLTGLAVQAQEIGGRVGKFGDRSVAIDGIFSLGEFSRLHGDVSFGSGVGLDLLYDFLYKPLGVQDPFFWYVGLGPSMIINDPFFLGASGEVGLEYRFERVPISLSADWRPVFWIIETTEIKFNGFGFNVRYIFNQ